MSQTLDEWLALTTESPLAPDLPICDPHHHLFEDPSCPNVYLKLGGAGMGVFGFGWHDRPAPPSSDEYARATAPYFLACIELLGADRCMFESNYPVDRRACPYVVMWNAFVRVTQDLSLSEIANLFHDTAARAYRLE